jgi:hypothetical protein
LKKRLWFRIVKVGRAVAEIAIACVLVSLTEGAFQTTVVCLLGLIYKRIRFLSSDRLASDEMIGFIVSRTGQFVKNDGDTFEQVERSVNEQLRSMKTAESTLIHVEDWILNAVFVLPLVKLCLTAAT